MDQKIIADKTQIEKAILDYYHQGHALYEPDLYREVLHQEWKFFLVEDARLRIVDREEFCGWYAPENKPSELIWETEIYTIDVTGDLAAVKLRIENQKVQYIDYLNLMKLDGKWWIVHKISHDVPK